MTTETEERLTAQLAARDERVRELLTERESEDAEV